MKHEEVLLYKENNKRYPLFCKNKNFAKILLCIAFKYGLVIECQCRGKKIRIPKTKQVKKFVQRKCFEYFNINISLKQLQYILKPRKKALPYTAIVIIETLYNLLKEDRWDNKWKEELVDYIKTSHKSEMKYEKFLLGNIPEKLMEHIDEFMKRTPSAAFICFSDSRSYFYDYFEDIEIMEQCNKNFPSSLFEKEHIPESMYNYQGNIVYLSHII